MSSGGFTQILPALRAASVYRDFFCLQNPFFLIFSCFGTKKVSMEKNCSPGIPFFKKNGSIDNIFSHRYFYTLFHTFFSLKSYKKDSSRILSKCPLASATGTTFLPYTSPLLLFIARSLNNILGIKIMALQINQEPNAHE